MRFLFSIEKSRGGGGYSPPSPIGSDAYAMGYEEMQAANRPSFIMQIAVCPTRDRQNGRARKMTKRFHIAVQERRQLL